MMECEKQHFKKKWSDVFNNRMISFETANEALVGNAGCANPILIIKRWKRVREWINEWYAGVTSLW